LVCGYVIFLNSEDFVFVFLWFDAISAKPNPNSPEESYKITAVFEDKTLIFENCKPKKV